MREHVRLPDLEHQLPLQRLREQGERWNVPVLQQGLRAQATHQLLLHAHGEGSADTVLQQEAPSDVQAVRSGALLHEVLHQLARDHRNDEAGEQEADNEQDDVEHLLDAVGGHDVDRPGRHLSQGPMQTGDVQEVRVDVPQRPDLSPIRDNLPVRRIVQPRDPELLRRRAADGHPRAAHEVVVDEDAKHDFKRLHEAPRALRPSQRGHLVQCAHEPGNTNQADQARELRGANEALGGVPI
mmetsp:Transcript_2195/g.8584  ORF Transcript_2195/g.8584 Transcript_2195/m.8584 type:complete len:240 (+) Transcript_2195:1390-2109(+)